MAKYFFKTCLFSELITQLPTADNRTWRKLRSTGVALAIILTLTVALTGCGVDGGSSSEEIQQNEVQPNHILNLKQADSIEEGFSWPEMSSMMYGNTAVTPLSPVNANFEGACGGSVDVISLGHNETTGMFALELHFNNYNDCEQTVNGTVVFSGVLNAGTFLPERFTVEFQGLSNTAVDESFVAYGSYSIDYLSGTKSNSIYMLINGSEVEYDMPFFGFGYSTLDGVTMLFSME